MSQIIDSYGDQRKPNKRCQHEPAYPPTSEPAKKAIQLAIRTVKLRSKFRVAKCLRAQVPLGPSPQRQYGQRMQGKL